MCLIKIKNAAFKCHLHKKSDESWTKSYMQGPPFKEIRGEPKRKWQLEFAVKCHHKDFKSDPKNAWSMVFEQAKGFDSHHHPYTPQ